MHARFFIEQKIDDAKEITIDDKEIHHRIAHVLRRQKGDTVIMSDNSGFKYQCVIKEIGKNDLTLEVKSKEANASEPEIKITLYQSLLKKDKMEWVLEKCTEIGVSRFVPVRTEHSVKLGINAGRAEKILKGAAEQCGRGKVPELDDVVSYEDAIMGAKASGSLNILLHNQSEFEDFSGFEFGKTQNINLFVGPEGGFSDAEIKLAKINGFQIISISSRTLRSETAAVAGSFYVLFCRADSH